MIHDAELVVRLGLHPTIGRPGPVLRRRRDGQTEEQHHPASPWQPTPPPSHGLRPPVAWSLPPRLFLLMPQRTPPRISQPTHPSNNPVWRRLCPHGTRPASDGEGPLGLKRGIRPPDDEIVRRLVGWHVPDHGAMEFPVGALEQAVLPRPEDLVVERSV